MGLTYRGADNTEHHPYIIHRAPLGTHERFVAFLIEHYGGAFPTWLAPIQVHAITVADRFNGHAQAVMDDLRNAMVRTQFDTSSESVNKKIRNASKAKIPNVLVFGEREVEEGTVTLRRFGSRDQRTMPLAEFQATLGSAIAQRDDGCFNWTSGG
jgi:threonyl-tRNA synthetase